MLRAAEPVAAVLPPPPTTTPPQQQQQQKTAEPKLATGDQDRKNKSVAAGGGAGGSTAAGCSCAYALGSGLRVFAPALNHQILAARGGRAGAGAGATAILLSFKVAPAHHLAVAVRVRQHNPDQYSLQSSRPAS